ncbi:hypothetical protein [Enterovibrio norvegicus]|uniref:hypothetical protein n=1 Tax=Enterovibrio norvegicus TaxID=188144 RepID=UPI0013CF5B11|nr:hypothetical protein [Enterovibrio norvegicus]
MSNNYKTSKSGFEIQDKETGHILLVKYENDVYQGVVIMPEQNEQLPLATWIKGENPFQNDNCFEGMQSGYAPNGYWWFNISPSIPFSKIMKEVEDLNKSGGFFRNLFKPKVRIERKLADIVIKSNQTGYIFIDIMNDLGGAAEEIMKASNLIQMTYAYARRSAATALYLQGLVDRDVFDHNLSFFNAVQVKTEHSVEFQELSFSEAIEYMQTYNPIITRMLIKKMAVIASEYVAPNEQLSDTDLIRAVMDAYSE